MSPARRLALVLAALVWAGGLRAEPLSGFYVHAADDAGAAYLTDEGCELLKVQSRFKHCVDEALLAALRDPGLAGLIDGVSFDYPWADVEPAPGRFDFGYFKRQLAELARLNAETGQRRRAILAVVPSTFPSHPSWHDAKVGPGRLPPWLFEEKGARKLETISSGYAMINSCLPMNVPAPWDKAFLAAYAELIRAFGAYVAQEPHRDLVAAVKLIGFVYLDELSHLPTAFPTAARPDCANERVVPGRRLEIPHDVERWRELGYSRRAALDSFRAVAETYKTAFPDMRLELSVSGQALPPIDDEGRAVTVGPDRRPNVRSPVAAVLPIIAIADATLGRRLAVSDHTLANFRPSAFLSAYREAGGAATIGYGNGWLISNDADCIMTGGWRIGGDCTGAWAMAQNLAEAELGGAGYMLLDLPDLARPDYRGALRRAHDLMAAHPDGPPRLATRAQQDFSTWSPVRVVLERPAAIAPPVELPGREGPAIAVVRETPEAGAHEISIRLRAPRAGDYAFSVFAALPNGARGARWVEVDAATEEGERSQGVFTFAGGKVQASRPVPVDPLSDDPARVNGAPGAAQSSTFGNPHGWTQFVVRLHAPAAGAVHVALRLVAPSPPIRNGGGFKESYPGDPRQSVAFWGPQLMELTSP